MSFLSFAGNRYFESLNWIDESCTIKWSLDNIVLNTDVSPFPGRINFNNTPHIEEILKDWDNDNIEQYNILASTQVGKTTIEFILISKTLATDPCMMQLTIPNDKGVADYISGKVDPFIRGIKSLKDKFISFKEDEKLRDKGSVKRVLNGTLYILGNTAANRRSKTVKYMFIDEAALFGSGHIEELIGRTKSFEKAFRKIFIVSSPKHSNDEMIIAYKNSYCKKDWTLECPECKKYFYPTSKHFKFMTKEEYKEKYSIQDIENINEYKKEAVKTARIECECGCKIDSRMKDNIIRDKRCKFMIVEGDKTDTILGYRINALGTYITSYETIARLLIEADDDIDKLETVYQDYFAEVFEDKVEETEKNDILLLGNEYEDLVIPDETIPNGIFMGVDSQKDHFWVEIQAFQYGGTSNTIFFKRVEELNEVQKLFEQTYYDKNGEKFYIHKMGIDRQGYVRKEVVLDDDGKEQIIETDNNIDKVDEWCMDMVERWGEDRVYPTIGVSKIIGDLTYKFTTIDKDFAKTRVPIPLKAMKISNLRAKNKLFDRVQRSIKVAKGEAEHTDRLFFVTKTIIDEIKAKEKSVSTDYHRQYTAEVFDYKTLPSGKKDKEKSWIRVYKDNHGTDTGTIITALADECRINAEVKPKKEDISKISSIMSSL